MKVEELLKLLTLRKSLTVNADSIDLVIESYLFLTDSIKFEDYAQETTLINLLKIKRAQLSTGPYPHVSLVESIHRIMSDFVLLYGVKELLVSKKIDNRILPFDQYTVNLGTTHGYDLYAEYKGVSLVGEAFNSTKKHYRPKLKSDINKLEKKHKEHAFNVILMNAEIDARPQKDWIHYLKVKIEGLE